MGNCTSNPRVVELQVERDGLMAQLKSMREDRNTISTNLVRVQNESADSLANQRKQLDDTKKELALIKKQLRTRTCLAEELERELETAARELKEAERTMKEQRRLINKLYKGKPNAPVYPDPKDPTSLPKKKAKPADTDSATELKQDEDDDDESDDEVTLPKTIRVKTLHIVLIGLSGSGKSSIIEALSKDVLSGKIRGSGLNSVTKNINRYGDIEFTNPEDHTDKYVVNLFDTIGLGDPNVSLNEILADIRSQFPIYLGTVNKIVFCFRYDRLRANLAKDLQQVYQLFVGLGADKTKNFAVCLTFCELYSEGTINRFWADLKTGMPLFDELNHLVPVHTAFPDLEECDQNPIIQRFLKKKHDESFLRLFNFIIKPPAPDFHPARPNPMGTPVPAYNQASNTIGLSQTIWKTFFE